MQQVFVKPHSAHLTRDTEIIGKMVHHSLSRTLTVSVFLALKDSIPRPRTRLEKIQSGKMNSLSWTPLVLTLWLSKFGIKILPRMILLEKESLTLLTFFIHVENHTTVKIEWFRDCQFDIQGKAGWQSVPDSWSEGDWRTPWSSSWSRMVI